MVSILIQSSKSFKFQTNKYPYNSLNTRQNQKSMNGLICTNGRVLYLVVKQALRALGISFQRDNQQGVLVWSDAVRLEFFNQIHSYQVINRLPFASTWCRKAPFVRLIQRIAKYYPDQFKFLPKSFVLPQDDKEFNEALDRHDKYYIYKPDRGSLGHGIRLITPDSYFKASARLAVAQEYIESYTIDNLKFDLRVYALICSLSPLRIYICRNGVARFCTEDSGGESKFSFLTNTAVNAKNPEANPDKMTRMIDDVFKEMAKSGVDTKALWNRIDNAIILTIISAYGFLSKCEKEQCPNLGLPRCFQIIGCDVLLDKKLNPYILEINHRPSMKTNTEHSHDLKIMMLKDALRIAAPLTPMQMLLKNTANYPETDDEMRQLIKDNPHVVAEINCLRSRNEIHNCFELVFPSKKHTLYNQILERVLKMPTDMSDDFSIPYETIERFTTIQEKRARRL
ncbi:Tubulin-tyrosine ligase family protein [Tritrichomonas foetus]|uniref:Tubulin-tyrosine ligase family protein n=1 Tax=Tritrichomonas foetus TaxID=1144522 RepID=A0A1J4KRI5_9EUKA|nr:Tubulin-tyrosine ligase family protein [Tritrichomonas foetus]|eukprot:OHT13544.1 Tubulin-tyrosine ligase family protein [Tritrichomonas foetus]